MKLTRRNYFSKKNTAISNSKVSDFLKSKEYYYAKHIAHTIEEERTPSMVLGSIVDEILSTGRVPQKYSVRCLKKDNPKLYEKQKLKPEYVVSQTQMDIAKTIAAKVRKQPFWRWYKKHGAQFQVVLQDTYCGNVPVCGLADVITVDHNTKTIYVDDFKTTSISGHVTAYRWYYKCVEYGYLRQLAHYTAMAQKIEPDYKVVGRHIVLSTSKFDCYPIYLFEFDEDLLVDAFNEFHTAVQLIDSETEWKDAPIDWQHIQYVINPKTQFNDSSEDDNNSEAE